MSTKSASTDLGLAIVQRFIRLKGGELAISSALEGTWVGWLLPRLELEASPERVAVLHAGRAS